MVSVSVSIFETKDKSLSISLNFWDHFYKVSVSVSKFDTNSKSLSLSIKNWDWVHWVSVSVSTCKNWSRTSLTVPLFFQWIFLDADKNFVYFFMLIKLICTSIIGQKIIISFNFQNWRKSSIFTSISQISIDHIKNFAYLGPKYSLSLLQNPVFQFAIDKIW